MNPGTSPPRVAFVDLAHHHASLHDELMAAMERVLGDADFILGHEVACFEEEFARYCGCEFGVGVDSGTSALELALRAYGIGVGDEVIVPANTFIATAFAVSSTGATPVLVDVDAATYTIDVTRLEGAVTGRTRAIIPVHLYGQPAHMDPILEMAQTRRLVVIEDACQAHGARYRGKRVGSLGHAAAFSFYPSKNLGACGDAGMVVTNDDAIARELKLLRNYGQPQKYYHLVQGYNRRLDTLQAALLRIKLRHLDTWNNARRARAAAYGRALGGPVRLPAQADYAEPVWHLYVIRTGARDALQEHLDDRGFSTGIHYPIPVHLQPAYKSLGYRQGAFPVTEQAAETILSLPMYPELPLGAIDEIADAIRAFFVGANGQSGAA